MARRRDSALWVKVVGGLLALGLFLLILKWLLITVAILVIPFGVWWAWDRSQRSTGRAAAPPPPGAAAAWARRREVESRASIDAAGGCGWCGARVAHVDPYTGRYVLPVDFHRAEIDQEAGLSSY